MGHVPRPIEIRPLRESDLDRVVAIDDRHTGVAKPGHWRDMLTGSQGRRRVALVAESDGEVVGYLVGETRAWEFGSPPTGWIYAVGVDPNACRQGIGTKLLRAACAAFAERDVQRVRTMVRKDDVQLLRFFRSDGFAAGPFVELEVEL